MSEGFSDDSINDITECVIDELSGNAKFSGVPVEVQSAETKRSDEQVAAS